MVSSNSFLRRALLADAVISGTTGLMMIAGATLLEAWLAVPATLLRYAGLSLLPFVAFVAWLASRETTSRPAVWTVIVCNALWAIDSVLLLVAGPIAPTALGYAFVLFQALVVAGFAEAQYVGLRKSTTVTA